MSSLDQAPMPSRDERIAALEQETLSSSEPIYHDPKLVELIAKLKVSDGFVKPAVGNSPAKEYTYERILKAMKKFQNGEIDINALSRGTEEFPLRDAVKNAIRETSGDIIQANRGLLMEFIRRDKNSGSLDTATTYGFDRRGVMMGNDGRYNIEALDLASDLDVNRSARLEVGHENGNLKALSVIFWNNKMNSAQFDAADTKPNLTLPQIRFHMSVNEVNKIFRENGGSSVPAARMAFVEDKQIRSVKLPV